MIQQDAGISDNLLALIICRQTNGSVLLEYSLSLIILDLVQEKEYSQESEISSDMD